MGWEAPWHWVILALVVIALFGYKKLPEASRALGRSLRIFKTEIKGMGEDDEARDSARDRTVAPAALEPRVAPTQPVEQPSPPKLEKVEPSAPPANVPGADQPGTSAS